MSSKQSNNKKVGMKINRRHFLGAALAAGGMSLLHPVGASPITDHELSDPLTLDLPRAKRLIEQGIIEPPGEFAIASLEGYRDIHPEVIQYLFQGEYGYTFLDIEHLDLELARSFATAPGSYFIGFNQLRNLQSECALALCAANVNLMFHALDAISIETAAVLAKNKGWLGFNCYRLSTEFVAMLMEHHGSIHMDLALEPSFETAVEIAQYRGYQFTIYGLPHHPSQELIAGLSSNPERSLKILHRHSDATYIAQSTIIDSILIS